MGVAGVQRRVGLIGVGLVGTAVAGVLVQHGFEVVGYDIDASRLDALGRLGGRRADSPAAVAAACDRLILCLLTADVVREVVEGERGILSAPARPGVVIGTTTCRPDETEALAARLRGQGIHLLDATIAGSSRQISAGQAVLMVGGDAEVHRSCADLWDALSTRVFHMGPAGSGARAKLAVNLVLGLNRLALAEGLVFARQLGLDARAALELFTATPAYSRAMDVKGERMVSGDFTPEARLAQHRKDVGMILDLAAERDQELPLSRTHAAVLDAAIAAGDGELDNSAVMRELIRRGGRDPGPSDPAAARAQGEGGG